MATSLPSEWQPIVQGDLAEKARHRIAQIRAALIANCHGARKNSDPTLAVGHAGVALFFAQEEKSLCGTKNQNSVAVPLLMQALKDEDDWWRTPSLYAGVVGIGWAITHISNELGTSVGLSLEHLDQELLEFCRDGKSELTGDLIDGFVGIGVYALERWPAPFAVDCIPLVINRLKSATLRDLGLAHGIAGVIAFLSAAARLDRRWKRQITTLVEQQIESVMRHRFSAAFPSAEVRGENRLAWCLGDLSLAVALYAAGREFNREDWINNGRHLAVAATERPLASTGIVDAGICHGAAGLGHLFNRLFQATGEERFVAAAREWFRRLLAMPERPDGVAGFAAWNYSAIEGWHRVADGGFLMGAAGIGLALMAAVNSCEPVWDRVLLLSQRK